MTTRGVVSRNAFIVGAALSRLGLILHLLLTRRESQISSSIIERVAVHVIDGSGVSRRDAHYLAVHQDTGRGSRPLVTLVWFATLSVRRPVPLITRQPLVVLIVDDRDLAVR